MWLVAAASATTWVVDAGGGGDFLGVGDGFAALADGDTLEIRAGTYPLTDVVSTAENITVVGEGAELVTLTNGASTDALLTLAGSAHLSGVLFDGAGTGGFSYVLRAQADTSLSDVRFHDFLPTEASVAAEAGDLVVERCAFVGDERGVTLYGADSVRVDDTTFVGTYRPITYSADITTLDLTVTSSTFVDFFIGIAVGSGVTVTMAAWDNVFETALLAPVYFYDEASADLDNNVFYDYTARSGTGYITGTNALFADPLFVDWTDDGDWTNDDFSPGPGSPAQDAALHSTSTTDGRGVSRPLDGDGDGVLVADLGAWEWYRDGDGDGFIDAAIGGDDCDDGEPRINPLGLDGCADGVDQDCDGTDSTTSCVPPDTGDPGDSAGDSGETGDPAETGESGGPSDTGHESAETAESGESGDSGEPGDSAESGESGDSADAESAGPDSGADSGSDTGSGGPRPPGEETCGCGGGRALFLGTLGAMALARRRRN